MYLYVYIIDFGCQSRSSDGLVGGQARDPKRRPTHTCCSQKSRLAVSHFLKLLPQIVAASMQCQCVVRASVARAPPKPHALSFAMSHAGRPIDIAALDHHDP